MNVRNFFLQSTAADSSDVRMVRECTNAWAVGRRNSFFLPGFPSSIQWVRGVRQSPRDCTGIIKIKKTPDPESVPDRALKVVMYFVLEVQASRKGVQVKAITIGVVAIVIGPEITAPDTGETHLKVEGFTVGPGDG